MKYTVVFKPSVAKQIRRLDKKEQKKIIAVAESLASNPRPYGYKKLVDKEILYRVRVGNYRIIYEIFDNILVINILQIKKRNERTY